MQSSKYTILFASANRGKFAEVAAYFKTFNVQVLDPLDLTANLGNPPDVEENCDSYYGNALLKAKAYFNWSKIASLGDDSGLEVEALIGRPGILSARYAGPKCSAQDNINKLLFELSNFKEAEKRRARFVCVLALVLSHERVLSVQAQLEGWIVHQQRGQAGFGYDPLFEVQGSNKTLAELKESGAKVETHRTLAIGKLAQDLFDELNP